MTKEKVNVVKGEFLFILILKLKNVYYNDFFLMLNI